MTKRIPLTQGKYAIVNDKDYEWLNQWRWYYHQGTNTGYARRDTNANGKRVRLYMHRQILDLPSGTMNDHVNGNGVDNRRANLRACSLAQNNMNRPRQINNTSGYMGISWHKGIGKWQSRVGSNGTQRHLGYFSNAKKAARTYDRAVLDLHGEFATLNFPQEAT